ncbi:hypothetical protein HBA54_05745 [Pelagibius litoralis]|uniref:histidine kinase n=1 Tax=Pelagibius litoralis TaxID=374515 RepID=A0A967EWS3_9PROT|nr:ATP-binding protein [Pelagibius litoralis]NIA68088.1 hypothetical protein [Pelagibius litoralis]
MDQHDSMPSIIGPDDDDVHRRRFRLGTQLLLGLATLAILLGSLAGYVIRHTEQAYLTERSIEEAERKFDLVRLSSLEDILSEDLPRLETTMSQMIVRDPDLFSAEIVNEDGTVLYAWQRDVDQSDELIEIAKSVTFAGENFGRMTFVWDNARLQEEIAKHTLVIAVSVGGACLLLSLLIFLLVNAFAIRPVNNLSARLMNFSHGVFVSPEALPSFTSVELLQLDEAVNSVGALLTQKVQREAELEEARDQAELANRAMTSFLANMSHELRTPLNAINGFSEMMVMELFGPLGDPRYVDYAKQVHGSGHHLLALINDILDISKIEAGKADLSIDDVDLQNEAETCLELVQDKAIQGKLRLVMDFAPGLPILRADGRRLRQVLLNLLSNAIKFTEPGGEITVSAEWSATAGLRVVVRDNGIGIPAGKLDTVMQPFGQVENPYTRQHEGTGLGLPMAAALVKLHDGEFAIESELGRGTVVTFVLPAGLAKVQHSAPLTLGSPRAVAAAARFHRA